MIFPMPEVKQLVLDRERIGTYRIISRYVLENAEFKAVERAAEDMLVELVSEVLTERVVNESQGIGYEVPASWWQHFKDTYRNTWWLRRLVKRRPVVWSSYTKTVTFNAKRLYPNADVPKQITPLGRPIIYETVTETDWTQ